MPEDFRFSEVPKPILHSAGNTLWYDDNTFVLRTKDMEKLRVFLEGFGLKFVPEQHGTGPVHYSCQVDQRVLEIYPTLPGTIFPRV